MTLLHQIPDADDQRPTTHFLPVVQTSFHKVNECCLLHLERTEANMIWRGGVKVDIVQRGGFWR